MEREPTEVSFIGRLILLTFLRLISASLNETIMQYSHFALPFESKLLLKTSQALKKTPSYFLAIS